MTIRKFLLLLPPSKQYAKKIYLSWFALLCVLVLHDDTSYAQNLQLLDAKYDSAWATITQAQLQKTIPAAVNSPVTMWQLGRRAVISEQSDAFYKILMPLAQKQLKSGYITHPVVIAAYVNSMTFTDLASTEEREQSRQWLAQALDTSKSRWYVLLVRAVAERHDGPEYGFRTSIKTLEEAVKLAPDVTFLRSELAWNYRAMAMYEREKAALWKRKSFQQYEKAVTLKPVNTQSYMGLLAYYKYDQRDAAKVKFYQNKVASLIPPGAKLKPKMREFLARYQIPLQKN